MLSLLSSGEKRPFIWPFKAFVICLLILGSGSSARAAAIIYSAPFGTTTSSHTMNTILPTGNGSVAHAIIYVPHLSTDPYVWITELGAGNFASSAGTFPSSTFVNSEQCTPLSDVTGNSFYDCNFVASTTYAITDSSVGNSSNYLYFQLLSGSTLYVNSSTTPAIDSSTVDTGINGHSYDWVGQIDDTPSAFSPSPFPASAASCNPFSTNLSTAFLNTSFSLSACFSFLFYPSPSDVSLVVASLEQGGGIWTRAPWGYITRIYTIMTDQATSSESTNLPSFTVQFPVGSPLHGDDWTIDMQDLLEQGSTTLASVVDPISGRSLRQIVEPWILLFIGISAIIIIFHDIMGMGDRRNNGEGGGGGNMNSDPYREWLYKNRR